MDPVITVKAFAVLTDAARSRHLVWVARDETKQPATFHRLLGGHVEFGELAAHAVVREIAEELHVELDDVAFLGVLENVFRYAGAPGHEIAGEGDLEGEIGDCRGKAVRGKGIRSR